jgi:hypothetical protein
MNIVYNLSEMRAIIGNRAVAIIGSGPSRLAYIFNPVTVCALAVNKSGHDYPAELTVTVEDHMAEVFYVGVRQPIVFVPTLEVMKYNVFNDTGYWTASILLRYICIEVAPPVVYLQGIDLSNDMYLPQTKHFQEIADRFPKQKIFFTRANNHTSCFPSAAPERAHIL